MAILQGVWKQHLRPRAVVGYGVKILLPSPPNYVSRSPGNSYYSLIAPDVTAAMLVERTKAKKSFGNLPLLLCKT